MFFNICMIFIVYDISVCFSIRMICIFGIFHYTSVIG
uniref:Uncharacterized protein n=1 Tax=Myoviridae sp. ctBtT5 TaxID=2825048 RepID=A0A8S5PY19_9CAUD|nr:MAG TPA: hypothetical protein [Myoviridae sp. ctBtT5]